MFNEDELRKMVVDLKLGETSENFEEMLEKVSKDNRLYKEIERVNSLKRKDDMLFMEFRSWFAHNMELDILSYVKGVF